MGGATSGQWTFAVWYLPHVPFVEPIAWTPHGGTPLLCCIKDWVWTAPYHGLRRSGIAGEQVVRKGGLVLDFGLFPTPKPTAKVLVESLGSPSGYGSHYLSAQELGDLWDVPILLLDSLRDAEVTGLMKGICQFPPSKLLHTEADLLLTAGFRGGVWGVGFQRQFWGLARASPVDGRRVGTMRSPCRGLGSRVGSRVGSQVGPRAGFAAGFP